jgi:hypothetical protein
MKAHACSPNTQEVEAGRRQVPGQPGLYSETLSQKTKKNHFFVDTLLIGM